LIWEFLCSPETVISTPCYETVIKLQAKKKPKKKITIHPSLKL